MGRQVKRLVFVIFALFSLEAFAAECNVNGKWYPYSSPQCSGSAPKPQDAPSRQAQVGITPPGYESAWSGLRSAALARCAKLYDSNYLQEVCLKNEEKGYLALKSNYDMPSKEAIAAKSRCAKSYDSWYLRDVCMKNESGSYQKLYK